jgi:hypothetical protein
MAITRRDVCFTPKSGHCHRFYALVLCRSLGPRQMSMMGTARTRLSGPRWARRIASNIAKLPDERYARIPHKKRATPPAINRGPVIVCAGSLTNKSLSPARTRSAPNIFFPNANILAFSFAVTRVSNSLGLALALVQKRLATSTSLGGDFAT